MKQGIHPTYHNDCQVTCACGNHFVTGSTLEKIEVDVCSSCHPFFTGQHKFVDVKGRIDKFNEKMAKGAVYKAKKKVAKKVTAKKTK